MGGGWGVGGGCWLKTMYHDSIFQAHEEFIMQNKKGGFQPYEDFTMQNKNRQLVKCPIGRFAV